MGNSLAIAAVTATLQNLIFLGIRTELGSGSITAQPLDKARSNADRSQVNLFLYHMAPNDAWRNRPPMKHTRNPITQAPLALDLYYLITAYGETDSEVKTHRLLGQVISTLHDCSTLTIADIEMATATELPDSDLHRQLEAIRIQPVHLSFEEMSQIWRLFQAQYRASVAYQVSVIFIDSTIPVRSALPVLVRGRDDRGAAVFYGLAPVLRGIQLPQRKPSADLGDVVTLEGDQLDSADLQVRLQNLHLPEPIDLIPLPDRAPTSLKIQLPTATDTTVGQWRAGRYQLSLVVQREDYAWTTNEVALMVAPQVLNVVVQSGGGRGRSLQLELTCLPQIHPHQKVMVFLADQGIPVEQVTTPEDPTAPSTVLATLKQIRPGAYVVRLRVDGADSFPIDLTCKPPQFATNQIVRIEA